jgi:hypothetical protein
MLLMPMLFLLFLSLSIEIEIAYIMYRVKPVVVLGPSQLCYAGNLQARARL